ncbi:histidine phosphatase family protein [Orbaceae bacterium ac157xtp]
MNMKKIFATTALIVSTLLTGCANTHKDDSVEIYFVRHGKTLFNTYDLVQGWADSPLTDQGVTVARYLGEGLKDINFDAYYTSDAGRQRETMQVILAQKGVKNAQVIELKELREAFFGGFEGGPNSVMAEKAAKQLGFKSGKELYTAMGAGKVGTEDMDAIAKADPKHQAETSAQLKARTQTALQTIINNAIKNKQHRVLVVSSGTAMKAMISDLTDNPAKNIPLSNATVVKITYKNNQITVNEIGSMEYVQKGKTRLNGN